MKRLIAEMSYGMTVSSSRQKHPEIFETIFAEGITLMGWPGPVIIIKRNGF
jgi:hypothetical protein